MFFTVQTKGRSASPKHVFLAGTRLTQRHEPWRVLELGFGTGQNFLATAQAARTHGQKHYVAIDAAPIPPEFVTSSSADAAFVQSLLRARSRGRPNRQRRKDRYLSYITSLPMAGYPALARAVHSIFHDPFAPDINPDCWTRAAFAWASATFGQMGSSRPTPLPAAFGEPCGMRAMLSLALQAMGRSAR